MIMLGQAWAHQDENVAVRKYFCPPSLPEWHGHMDAQEGEQVWHNVTHQHQLYTIYHEITARVCRGKYVPAPIPLRREIEAGLLGESVGEVVKKKNVYIFRMLLFW